MINITFNSCCNSRFENDQDFEVQNSVIASVPFDVLHTHTDISHASAHVLPWLQQTDVIMFLFIALSLTVCCLYPWPLFAVMLRGYRAGLERRSVSSCSTSQLSSLAILWGLWQVGSWLSSSSPSYLSCWCLLWFLLRWDDHASALPLIDRLMWNGWSVHQWLFLMIHQLVMLLLWTNFADCCQAGQIWAEELC